MGQKGDESAVIDSPVKWLQSTVVVVNILLVPIIPTRRQKCKGINLQEKLKQFGGEEKLSEIYSALSRSFTLFETIQPDELSSVFPTLRKNSKGHVD